MWPQLILLVVSFLVQAFLAPKIKQENARASSLKDVQFPKANEGSPAILVLGKVRLRSPNTLWYGDFESIAQTKKMKTGAFSSEKVTVGYKYYLGMDLGICIGSGVKVLGIYMEDKIVWDFATEGFISGTFPDPLTLRIDKEEMWGGDKEGGGWLGDVVFYSGQNPQDTDTYMSGVAPPYLGYNLISHMVFKQNYIGTRAFLRPISVEVSKYPNNLGLTGNKHIIGEDLNPAEALYHLYTSNEGALNRLSSELDIPSFIDVGNTLYTETHGISIELSISNSGKEAISEVLRQIDGIMYVDSITGKIKLKLIRGDYDPDTLVILDESSISRIHDFTRTSWADTINQQHLTFNSRAKGYTDATVMVQDMANINTKGRVQASSVSLPWVTEGQLALEIATRELSQTSVPLFKVKIEMNRSSYSFEPGALFRLSWADYGIVEVVMRVVRFDFGSLADGKVSFEAIQDIFAINEAVFAPPSDTEWTNLDRIAVEPTDRIFAEMPYFFIQELGAHIALPVNPDITFVTTMARAENEGQEGFSTNLDDVTDLPNPVVGIDHISYSNTALLSIAILDTDGIEVGEITTVTVKTLSPLPVSGADSEVEIPLFLKTTGSLSSGDNSFFLNGELFTYTSVTDLGLGIYTLNTVKRALLDTEYLGHDVDDVLYFIEGLAEVSTGPWASTGNLYAKYSSFTDIDETNIEDTSQEAIARNKRYERPLPVDLIKVNGITRSASQIVFLSGITDLDFTWERRSRLNGVIAFEDSGDETPESGQKSTLVLEIDGTPFGSPITDIAGTSQSISVSGMPAGEGEVIITSVRDGLDSWTDARYKFTIEEGFALLLESGDSLLLESGDRLILE